MYISHGNVDVPSNIFDIIKINVFPVWFLEKPGETNISESFTLTKFTTFSIYKRLNSNLF